MDTNAERALLPSVLAMVAGSALSAFCAYAMVSAVHGFLTQGTRAQEGINYQTPGILAGNLAFWGSFSLIGLGAGIWGVRRRRLRAD